MQKAEVQQSNVQSQPAAKKSGVDVIEPAQTEETAQLEAMIESSPRMARLGGLAAMMSGAPATNSIPARAAQLKMMQRIANGSQPALQRRVEMIHNSPRQQGAQKFSDDVSNSPMMVAQRKRYEGMFGAAQRVGDEEALQPKLASEATVQLEQQADAKPNNTGLPDNLKSGIENLSGMSMDGVKVHYNSSQPAQLNALAYAQGTDIHVAPGQEQHLPHEAWHVVQQAQVRVRPTMQMRGGISVNDDAGLEKEADVMGSRAASMVATTAHTTIPSTVNSNAPVQGVWIAEGKIIDRATVDGNPVCYLNLILSKEHPFNQCSNAYQQMEDCDFSELHFNLNESLFAEQSYAIDLIINQATQWLQNRLPKDEGDEVVNDEDHPEGSAIECALELEDLDVAYWECFDINWLASFFFDLDAVKNQVNINEQNGINVATAAFYEWMTKGVMTRSEIFELVKNKNSAIQNTSQTTTQLARGAGITGPKSYQSSTVGQYTNVAYTRNGNGYFNFAAPTQKTMWTNPIYGDAVDMNAGCKIAGYGIMKDNKTKVKLQTATRAQHFSIANRIAKIAGSGSPDNYTWHHLITKYQMVLVDRKVHQQHGHNGGIFLWK